MRKLLAQIHVSVDGWMAGPDNDLMGWVQIQFDSDLNNYIDNLMAPCDHIVMGRKLGEGFIPHWLARPAHEDPAGIDKINNCSKTVFSNTLDTSPWANTEIAKGDVKAVIQRLKAEEGKGDIITYGGVVLIQQLVKEDLIDELYLLMNPVALGDIEGGRVFTERKGYNIVEAKSFECGITVLHYRKKT